MKHGYPALTVAALIKRLQKKPPKMRVFIYEGSVVGLRTEKRGSFPHVVLSTDLNGTP